MSYPRSPGYTDRGTSVGRVRVRVPSSSRPRSHGRTRVPVYDPLRPVAPPTLQSILAQLGPLFGPILSDQQIAARAKGLVTPQIQAAIAAITGDINRRSTASAQIIQAATKGYADAIANLPGHVQADADRAAAQRANANAAFAGFLASQGQQAGGELGGKVTQLGGGQAAQQLAQGASAGAGSYNAVNAAAGGTADLNSIITGGGARRSFADMLPGIVALKGEQTLGDVQRQYASSLADQIGALRAKVPEMVTSLVMQLSQTRDAKKQAKLQTALSYLNSIAGREVQKAIANLGYQGKIYSTDANAYTQGQNRASRERIAQLNRDAKVAAAQASQGFQITKQQNNQINTTYKSAVNKAAQMRAGTYGGGASSGAQQIDPKTGNLVTGKGSGGKHLDYAHAYRAIYNYLYGAFSSFLPDGRIRMLTMRALRAGGYTKNR